MESNKRIGKIITTISVLILVLLVLPLAVSIFYPWTKLVCTVEDFNLLTGHARITKYYWYIQYSQKIEETELSTILENTPPSNEENWVRVNTFSPGVGHSPHHRYHSALSAVAKFSRITDEEVFGKNWSADALDKAAQEMLRAIKFGDDSEYPMQLYSMIDKLESQTQIKPENIPVYIPKNP